MTTEDVCDICRSFPHVQEDVKWGNDLVFMIGSKMFAVVDLTQTEFDHYSFKCSPEDFEKLLERDGIVPAPYMARAQWVAVTKPDLLSADEARHYLRQAYEIIKAKLPKKTQAELS
jgi:predicted DNA-binding protein (MmcQ/YjbR family)